MRELIPHSFGERCDLRNRPGLLLSHALRTLSAHMQAKSD